MNRIMDGIIDFFHPEGGEQGNKSGRQKSVEYEITKEELLHALGFEPTQVTFIQYNYQKGILTVKTK